MREFMMRVSAISVMLMCAMARPAAAQQWNDPRALELVREATELRARQLADTGLVDYQARAHGYVTFLAQLGEGFREPPQIVKADELALEVYWAAPNLSKQRIIGRRDTTLLPTDIQYHRDHLGIVQNNFPAIIRLGDGDEVSDVPHPLSPMGVRLYEFALSDSLRITIPGRVINVYEVKVRPRDDRQPRVIGSLFLDRDNRQVVRMALSFTRAAFIDKQLEDLFIVLENGLVGTRFWLPRRQEIEIRRTATWLDYPVRGIIRGRWEIGEYEVNKGIPRARFSGSEIVMAPPEEQREYVWPSARILDSLPPDVRAVTAEEIRRVQAETRELVRAQALRRVRASPLAARSISDVARFNRVEGVALGAGISGQLGRGFGVFARARYGLEDSKWKPRFGVKWEHARGGSAQFYGSGDLRDAGDVPERSLAFNSLAAQELGSDYTNPYWVGALGIAVSLPFKGIIWSVDYAMETHDPLEIHATPASGAFTQPVSAAPGRVVRLALRADRATTLGWFGTELRGHLELRSTGTDAVVERECVGPCGRTRVLRGAFVLEAERPTGHVRLLSRSIGAAALESEHHLAQELVFFGGPLSAPGYTFHGLVGDRAISQRFELQFPVPFLAVRLGRFGRTPARAILAPHVAGVALRAVPTNVPISRGAQLPVDSPDPLRPVPSGFYPSVGVGLLTFFDLLRFDVARGLNGGRWIFSVDINRTFWGVL